MKIYTDTIYVKDIVGTNDMNSWTEYLLQPSSIISIIAIVVSVIAVLFSIKYNRKSLKMAHKHNMLSVRPIINTTIALQKKPTFILENNGIGPAFIKKISFTYKDKTAENISTLLDLIKHENNFPNININYSENKLKSSFSLSEKSKIIIFSTDLSKENMEDIQQFNRIFEKIGTSILYSDIYKNEYKKIC